MQAAVDPRAANAKGGIVAHREGILGDEHGGNAIQEDIPRFWKQVPDKREEQLIGLMLLLIWLIKDESIK